MYYIHAVILLLPIGDILDEEPDIFDICNFLANHKHKWRAIGEGLRVQYGELTNIEQKYQTR